MKKAKFGSSVAGNNQKGAKKSQNRNLKEEKLVKLKSLHNFFISLKKFLLGCLGLRSFSVPLWNTLTFPSIPKLNMLTYPNCYRGKNWAFESYWWTKWILRSPHELVPGFLMEEMFVGESCWNSSHLDLIHPMYKWTQKCWSHCIIKMLGSTEYELSLGRATLAFSSPLLI